MPVTTRSSWVQPDHYYTLGNFLGTIDETFFSNEELYGFAGNDTLQGGSGSDTLDGGSGADVLVGGAGNDTMYGGYGSDQFIIDEGDTIVEGQFQGTDTVLAGFSYTLADNFERLTLTGTAAIDGTGNAAANILTGNAAANTLDGLGEADLLYGGGGNDLLTGGLQADRMWGGTGRDTFIFNAVNESSASLTTADRIEDFVTAVDKIKLSPIDASSVLTGEQGFVWRGTGLIGTSASGEVSYRKFDLTGTANDYTAIYIDTDSDATVEMVIRLKGLVTLAASDFIL